MVTSATDLSGRIWSILASVHDPEIPALDIVEMGIARGVEVHGEQIRVTITPTYSGCPANGAIQLEVRNALDQAGFNAAEIIVSHAEAWTTDWLTDRAREKLRANGIAPPIGKAGVRAAGKRALFAPTPDPACPRCGAATTERISEFGSTACKALYRCLACHEPFDYFKCI